MPEPTKSTQEASKTTESNPSSASGSTTGATGYSASQTPGGGQTASGISGSAARQAREHSSFGYGQSESTSTRGSEAGEIFDQARQGISDTYNRASQGLNETWEQAMDYSREHPGKSTLIAFGVGVGVGLLVANSFTTRSRTRRIVPPVMNALSEIASELFR
ncbi:MAG: hypothetical protein ACREAB_03600 [Blastocatellia bacterium]